MAKRRKDQLGVVGFASALMRNLSQQRSLKKARDAKNVPPPPPQQKKPKDIRTPEEIRAAVDVTRSNLVDAVDGIKYDLDVCARARDLRDRVAADIPAEYRGRTPALVVVGSILFAGLGSIAAAIVARVRR